MLGILDMELKSEAESKITHQKTSLLQGILMEQIDGQYAEFLHQNGLKPYSQGILYQKDRCIWRVRTLNREAYEKIILPLTSSDFTTIHFEHDDSEYQVLSKDIYTTSYRELIEKYYFSDCSRYIRIRFISPTAFKSDGKYLFYPDMKLIFQSLMNKYDAFASKETIGDEEILNQLVECIQVLQYQLKSVYFHLEGIKIPAFTGMLFLKMNGPQALINLATLLFQYGTYSGIGIKTAIGMGAFEIVNKGEKDD